MGVYRVSIEEEADTGYEHHDPLEVLAVDGLVDLSHANLTVLYITLLVVRAVRQGAVTDRHTCSCSKSRARSVLYSRLRSRPIAKI